VQDRLEIWDVRRRRRVSTLRPTSGVSSARFSPDGRLLAVGDQRGRVQVFSTATWKPVTPSFVGGRAVGMTFTRDGRTFATGNTDGTVRLFTPEGTHLIAAHENGRAYRWDIRPVSLVRQACEVAGRRLTRAEWNAFLPERRYQPAC
jgi:WD40 repeat protein